MTVILLLLLVLCAVSLVLTAHFSRGVRSFRFEPMAPAGRRVAALPPSPRPSGSMRGKVLIYSGGILLLAAVCAFLWTRQAPSSSQQQEEAPADPVRPALRRGSDSGQVGGDPGSAAGGG